MTLINKLINQINSDRGVTNQTKRGHLFLSIESCVYNIMMIDGPMAEHGGASTVRSFGTESDAVVFLKKIKATKV